MKEMTRDMAIDLLEAEGICHIHGEEKTFFRGYIDRKCQSCMEIKEKERIEVIRQAKKVLGFL